LILTTKDIETGKIFLSKYTNHINTSAEVCLSGETFSEAHQALSPFVILEPTEASLDFKSAILCAYDGAINGTDMEKLDTYINVAKSNIEKLEVEGKTTLSCPEYLAIYFYTLEWQNNKLNTYSCLNQDLTNPDKKGLIKWKHYLHYLFAGIRKIPKWEGSQDLYHGINHNLVVEFPDKYIVGRKITWYECTSTTTHFETMLSILPFGSPRTVFIISGVFSGRSIKQFSATPNNADILIPPGSRFEIIGITRLDEFSFIIRMKQIPTLEILLGLE